MELDTTGVIILVASLALWFILMMSGAPLYVAFLAAAMPVIFLIAGNGPLFIGKLAVDSVWSFTLIAIPLFILLGNVMGSCGATGLLFDLARAWVGHIHGGLGMAAIIACAMFGSMCGSALATALAVGSIAVPELSKAGYSRETSAAICGSAGGLGLLIPPSIDFVILGVLLKISVGDLFIAGIVPGLIVTSFLCVACYLWMRRKKEIKVLERCSWGERRKATIRALPLATLPLAIAGSLWGGICTPTEAAGVGCFVALLLARFYFRRFGWNELKTCLSDTIRSSAAIFCIIAGAVIFGRALAYVGIPQMAGKNIMALGVGPASFKLLFLGAFFLLGMFFDFFVLIYVALPPFISALGFYNVPLVPFGVVFVVIAFIGQLTPPVAITLYAAATGAKASAFGTIRETPYFLIAWIAAALLFFFVPNIVIY